MGTVVTYFLPRRWAQRYAEIYVLNGELAAEIYATEHMHMEWFPNLMHHMELYRELVVKEIKRRLGKELRKKKLSPQDPKSTA